MIYVKRFQELERGTRFISDVILNGSFDHVHVVSSFQLPRHGQSYLIAGIFLRSLMPCRKINRMVKGHRTSGEVFLLSDTSKSSSGFKKINEWYPRGLQISLHIRSPGLQDYSKV